MFTPLLRRTSLHDYAWLCQLDDIKGVDIGQSYRSDKAAMRFVGAIASNERAKLTQELEEIPFVTLTCDGSSDAASLEQEILFVHYCHNGVVSSKFIGIATPNRADADGVLACILGSLSGLMTLLMNIF